MPGTSASSPPPKEQLTQALGYGSAGLVMWAMLLYLGCLHVWPRLRGWGNYPYLMILVYALPLFAVASAVLSVVLLTSKLPWPVRLVVLFLNTSALVVAYAIWSSN